MPRRVVAGVVAWAAVWSIACGNGSGMGPSGERSYRGSVSDSAGDVVSRDGARHHDFVGATVEVASGQVTLTITFAGPLSGTEGFWGAFFDTDENANTGDPYGFDAGMDYAIIGDSRFASVLRYDPTSPGVDIDLVSVVQSSDTVLRTTIPLSDLKDDGRFLFTLISYWISADNSDGDIADFMPEFDKFGATR